MNFLYKKTINHLQKLKNIYNIFIVLSILMFAYILLDIYSRSKKIISFVDETAKSQQGATDDRLVIKPRFQIERTRDDFHYIVSERGIWNTETDVVDLFNVQGESTIGTVRSDVLTVKENNTLLEFRGNPIFTLYLESETNEEKVENEKDK